MILEEIKNIKESKKDLRKFGLTVGIVLLIIAAFIFWKGKGSYPVFGVIGSILVIAGLLFPVILGPLNKVWMTLAILMGWVMTRVILTILFFIVLTPLRFIAKIFGKEFLDLKIDKTRKSYWEIRERKEMKPLDYERQF
ncbi:MAG: SxtJ family membrane protein [Ignavibacteriaceae bacterium]|jgi:polyferredoxin